MEHTEIFNDQLLGTFIDGELDAANREAIINAMETDPVLRERVYRLRRARDLMQLGFGEASAPSGGRQRPLLARRLFSTRVAASFAALAVAFGAGMLGQHYLGDTANNPPVLVSASQQQTDRLILHVSQSDQAQFIRALEFTERFLADHEASGNEIEVVAHAGGLDLLRDDVSPLRKKIIKLMQQYDNVSFIACANAISMLRANGTEPRIIPGISSNSTAFDHIVNRLQGGGWTYLKVESLPEA